MPAADWETYRLGARIPSLDGLVSAEARDQIDRLQRATSAVAAMASASSPLGTASASDDARFIGRLLLGLLCRGWPTFSSPDVELALLGSMDPAAGLVHRETVQTGPVGWRLDRVDPVPAGEWDDAIRGALLRGDRRLGIDEVVVGMLSDSDAEFEFYRDHLSPLLGQAIGWLELQRPIASMVSEDAPGRQRVGSGRVDFALDLPGEQGPIRLVIELDGPHHTQPPCRRWDRTRDQLLSNHGGETRRVPVETLGDGSLNHLPDVLDAIIANNPFPFTDIEAGDNALHDSRRREATRLILTPHAVARVQLALCRALIDGGLGLSVPEWTVAVVEREVPCTELALRDWLQGLTHLCRLYGVPVGVERVRLLVAEEHLASFPATTWTSEAGSTPRVVTERLGVGGGLRAVDLGIDVSVGAHPTRCYPTDPLGQSKQETVAEAVAASNRTTQGALADVRERQEFLLKALVDVQRRQEDLVRRHDGLLPLLAELRRQQADLSEGLAGVRGVTDSTQATALAIRKTGDALGPTLGAAVGEVRTDLMAEMARARRVQIVSLIAILIALGMAGAALARILPMP